MFRGIKGFFLDFILFFILLIIYFIGLNSFNLFYKIYSNSNENITLNLLKSYDLWYTFLIALFTILPIFFILYFIVKAINKIQYFKTKKDILLIFDMIQSTCFAIVIIICSLLGKYIIKSENLLEVRKDYKLAIKQIENNQLENIDTYLVKVEADSMPGIYVDDSKYVGLSTLNINKPTDYANYMRKDYGVYERIYIPTPMLENLNIPIRDLQEYTKEQYKIFEQKYNITYTNVENLKIATNIVKIQ